MIMEKYINSIAPTTIYGELNTWYDDQVDFNMFFINNKRLT